jgi:hypothetical protein
VRKPLLLKIGVGLGALTLFGFLFVRSLQDARSAPFTVERQHLRNWTLVLESGTSASDPLLALRPPPELAAGLFRQVFSRVMESLNTPTAPAVPVVLRGEFDGVLADRFTPDALLAAARASMLDAADSMPRCLVHRRVSEPGVTRQVYFALFDAPAIGRFRAELGLEPAALSPVLFIAGAGSGFSAWLPQRVNAETECLAPVVIDG